MSFQIFSDRSRKVQGDATGVKTLSPQNNFEVPVDKQNPGNLIFPNGGTQAEKTSHELYEPENKKPEKSEDVKEIIESVLSQLENLYNDEREYVKGLNQLTELLKESPQDGDPNNS